MSSVRKMQLAGASIHESFKPGSDYFYGMGHQCQVGDIESGCVITITGGSKLTITGTVAKNVKFNITTGGIIIFKKTPPQCVLDNLECDTSSKVLIDEKLPTLNKISNQNTQQTCALSSQEILNSLAAYLNDQPKSMPIGSISPTSQSQSTNHKSQTTQSKTPDTKPAIDPCDISVRNAQPPGGPKI